VSVIHESHADDLDSSDKGSIMNKSTRLDRRKRAASKLRRLIAYIRLCELNDLPLYPGTYGALKHYEREYRSTFTIWERILKYFGLTR
jgi:hypothetical protein